MSSTQGDKLSCACRDHTSFGFQQGSWLPGQTSSPYQQQSLALSIRVSRRDIGVINGQTVFSLLLRLYLLRMIKSPLAPRRNIVRATHLNSSQHSFSSISLRRPVTVILVMLCYLRCIGLTLGGKGGVDPIGLPPELFSFPHYFI